MRKLGPFKLLPLSPGSLYVCLTEVFWGNMKKNRNIKYSFRYVCISNTDLLTYFLKPTIVHSATLLSVAL